MYMYFTPFEYAYMPPERKIADGSPFSTFSEREGGNSSKAVRFGREMFYKETFGNEVFLTDIMGLVNGAVTVPSIAKAIVALGGEGTSNLRVALAKDVTIGEKTYKKGEKIDTGIDVLKGTMAPVGMPVSWDRGQVKVGITCAACHATVTRDAAQLIEGVPNADINTGLLLLAMSSNSAAYFTHSDVKVMADYMKKAAGLVEAADGSKQPLPDAESLEAAVDETFAAWPPGNFDSSTDLVANPTSIPDSFTWQAHPYGWSGFAAIGPFKGLSSLNNNVHAQNSDALAQSESSRALFDMDKEVFIGTILQRAANPIFRYKAESGKKPSEFFESVDPTPGVPGVNELVKLPSFPKTNYAAPDGLYGGSPGYRFGEQIDAMSVFQNKLRPPAIPKEDRPDPKTALEGQRIFRKAQCISCHAGPAFTNHKVIAAERLGVEPTRALAFQKTERVLGEAYMYDSNTPLPLPSNPKIEKLAITEEQSKQLQLAYAHEGTNGGYKVESLTGLYWTAPYLHDGGVSVGLSATKDLGVAGTLLRGIAPDPRNSLRALLDRKLRQKVVEANEASGALRRTHVVGKGHHFWADEEAGFTRKEQDALIEYLLSLTVK